MSLFYYTKIVGISIDSLEHMRLSSLFVLVLLTVKLNAQVSSKDHEITVSSSHFSIQGSTNVNQFECELNNYVPTDTFNIQSRWDTRSIRFENLILHYPIAAFDCGLEAMNKDMQGLLNSDQYPMLALHIKQIFLKDNQKAIETLFVNSVVDLTVAGIKREVKVSDGVVENHSASSLTFSGVVDINMRDFGLDPPVKFLGMVQVHEKLTVNFAVRMEVRTL